MQKELYLVAEGSGGGADGYDGSESGVEPDYAESYFDSEEAHDILFDMSDEQVTAALRYFTSTAQRTNMLTKTHSNDLEMIAQLLTDKEKDLEMTAKIGQSLLQRNKQLMVKIETMEDYLSQTTENANQLQHDLQMKNKLVEFYTQDDDMNSTTSSGADRDRSIDDEEIVKLTNRCKKLEKDNQCLFSEALGLKQMTDEMEEKEEALVLDCIEQLASAKLQITQLTDEIAMKFEDNLQQQMEISQLINMVVELQRKQKVLMDENGDLQEQLAASNENRENLQEQLHEMQVKFRETKELMIEHQEELKILKSRLDSGDNPCDWMSDSGHSLNLQDSLATEIEETVRRDITSSLVMEKSKVQNKRVLDNVRHLNVKGSDTTSGRTSPASVWSLASDERSESHFDLESRARKPTRKLQIVKPMEGSDTLNKWHHLASKNIKGGLDVSAEEKTIPDLGGLVDDEADISNPHDATDGHLDTPAVAAGGNENTPGSTQEAEKEEKTSSPRARPAVRPRPKPRPRVLSDVSTPQKKTIITRNSAVLRNVRKGRSLLNSQQKEGRSQAEVIGMIASAMGKVNVDAGAEQRILSSLNHSSVEERVELKENTNPVRSDYTDMPNVAKALNKAAQLNDYDKESELSPNVERGKDDCDDLGEADSAIGNSVGNRSTTSTVTLSSTPRRVETDLRSISGPLGLLNRANPSEPRNNVDIMSNLLRYSAGEDASVLDTVIHTDRKTNPVLDSGLNNSKPVSDTEGSSDVINNNLATNVTRILNSGTEDDGDVSVTSSIKTNKSTSLLDMVTTSRLTVRPIAGLGNLVGLDTSVIDLPPNDAGLSQQLDGDELDIDVDDKTRTEATEATSDQPTAAGSKGIKKEAGLFGYLTSFLS